MLATTIDSARIGSWQVTGNRAAVALLNGAIDQGRVSHAYLFTGPDRVGKRTMAVDFARALNCNTEEAIAPASTDPKASVPCETCSACDRIARMSHPDVQLLTALSQTSKDADARSAQRRVMIGIDLIIDLQADAMLKPYEGRAKVFIIDDAHRMSPEASNALLKTLEEPPDSVHILLTAPSVELLPETIASRCHVVKLRSVPANEIEDALVNRFDVAREEARTLSKLSMGAPGWAIAASRDPSLLDARRQAVYRIVDVLASDLADRFDYAFEMTREFRQNRATALEEVARWLEILRDVAMLQNGLRENVIFDDRTDELGELAHALTPSDVAQAASAVGKTRDALMLNAFPQLAFDGMMLELPTPA
jgi:DNA polymerase-3 subunit delta'